MEKKKLCALLLSGLLLITVTGCGSAFDKEYYEEQLYVSEFDLPDDDTAAEIRNYSMLKTALISMVNNRKTQEELRFTNYNGNPSEDLADACFEIKSANPLGAYAVESMSYDTNVIVSYYVANIYVTYKATAVDASEIKQAATTEAFDALLYDALARFEEQTIIRVYSADVNEEYIRDLIRDYGFSHPADMITVPEVCVDTYPKDGANHICVISIDYGLPGRSLIPMTNTLKEKIRSLSAAMKETEPAKLTLECAASLCAECTVDPEPEADYGSSAYGALIEHSADAKGLALAFRALCDASGLDCIVVEGKIGASGARTHYWNILTLDGESYHVDLSVFSEAPAAAFLRSDAELWGQYTWDAERYPACSGTLTYYDVSGEQPPEEQEEPEELAPQDEAASEELPDAAEPETENPEKIENNP